MILFTSSISITQLAKYFRSLACKVCTLDEDGTRIKDSHMDKMSLKDFTNMMCEYIANFTFPFLSANAEEEGEKESPKQSGEPSEAT